MMKHFVLLTGVLLLSLFRQDPIDMVVSYRIPPQARKISLAQYKLEKAKFSNRYYPLDFKNLYQIKGVLMGIEVGKYPLSYPVTLEKLKEAGPELLRKNEKMISNEIVRLNNIRILVRKCHTGDEFHYRFYSDFKHDTNLSGILEFKKRDQQQAELLFNQLLNSIQWRR